MKEGQEIGEAVLDAEVRIGELMRDVPKAKKQYESALATDGQSKTKTEAVAKMMGMDAATDKNKVEHMIKRFETLAAHPEIVAQAAPPRSRRAHRPTGTASDRHEAL